MYVKKFSFELEGLVARAGLEFQIACLRDPRRAGIPSELHLALLSFILSLPSPNLNNQGNLVQRTEVTSRDRRSSLGLRAPS